MLKDIIIIVAKVSLAMDRPKARLSPHPLVLRKQRLNRVSKRQISALDEICILNNPNDDENN